MLSFSQSAVTDTDRILDRGHGWTDGGTNGRRATLNAAPTRETISEMIVAGVVAESSAWNVASPVNGVDHERISTDRQGM